MGSGMINVSTNITQVVDRLVIKLSALADKDKVMRTVATGMLNVVKVRIHQDGIATNGGQIGTYSEGYMKVRTGDFRSPLISRGVNKGGQRPRYNRTNDTKVVVSLTRQMENDWSIQPTDEGYGLGYNNPDNFKKVGYVENTYNKKIFSLTEAEKKLAVEIALEATDLILE